MAMEFFDQHDGDYIAVEQLATAAGVSQRTLRDAFQWYFGLSPVQYLKWRTIHQVTSGKSRVTAAPIWCPASPSLRAGFRSTQFTQLVSRPITFSRRKTSFSSSSTTTSIRRRPVRRVARLVRRFVDVEDSKTSPRKKIASGGGRAARNAS